MDLQSFSQKRFGSTCILLKRSASQRVPGEPFGQLPGPAVWLASKRGPHWGQGHVSAKPTVRQTLRTKVGSVV